MSINRGCGNDKNLPIPDPDIIKKPRPVKIGCLDLYDNKTVSGIGSIASKVPPEAGEALGCFELYRRRNKNMLHCPSDAGVEDRYKTFINALNNSYNSEKIKIVEKEEILPHYEEEYLALITPDEKRGIKNLSCPKELFPEEGKLVYWIRDQSYWLITSYEETEKAYFRGTIEKCNYILTWQDNKGNICRQRVKMQGPVETKYKNENMGDFIMGKANETNTIWIAKTSQTEHLKRYKKLILNDKAYDITVINDVSSIIQINLIEGYINPDEDSLVAGQEIAAGQIPIDYDVYTSIDGITELPLKPFTFTTVIYKDGQLLGIKPNITIEGEATYENGVITPTGYGKIIIKICYKGYPVSKKYEIEILEDKVVETYCEIVGADTIDMYGSAVYQLVENTGGTQTALNSDIIQIDSRHLDRAVISKRDDLKIEVSSKKLGLFKLFAVVDGKRVEKEVRIISPW